MTTRPAQAWRLLTHAVLLELAIWRMLLRWIARRPDEPAGAVAVGNARLVAPVLWLWIAASFAEVIAHPQRTHHRDDVRRRPRRRPRRTLGRRAA